MDDSWKYYLGFCNQQNEPRREDAFSGSGTGTCIPLQRPLNIRLNPEFTCVERKNVLPRDEGPLNGIELFCPRLKVKRFQRPPTCEVNECDDLELPFPLDEYQFLCHEIPDPMWGSTFCIQRIFLLLHVTPEVADIEARICDLWSFFERKSPHGVLVKDIRLLLGTIFSLRSQNHKDETKKFRESLLCKALGQLKRGIRVQRLSDKEDLSGLTGALGDFGEIIRRKDPELVQGAIEILELWLNVYGRNASAEVKNPTRVDKSGTCYEFQDQMLDQYTFATCVEKSHLGKKLVKYLSNNESTPDTLFVQLTAIAAEVIELSPKIRLLALKLPLIESVLLNLKYPDTGNQLLIHAIEIIYGILAYSLDDDEVNQLSELKPEAFRVLLFRFLQRMKYIRSKTEMSLRNDVGFAIYLLIKFYPSLRQKFGRHASVLAGIVANNVIKQKDLPFILDSTPEDLELLKILIWILQLILESDATSDEIANRYQLVCVMMRILIGPCHILEHLSDDDRFLEPLSKVAALTLNTMAKRFPLLFQQPEGIDSMLSVLDMYSEFGTLDIRIVAIFMDILRQLLTEDVDGMMEYFVQRSAMRIFTDVLKKFSKQEWAMSDEPIMCNVLMCCSILGQYDEAQRAIFTESNGVKIIVRLINLLAYSYSDQRHMNPTLHICVSEVVWQCLAESPSALEQFLAYEGIFRMLDLLEVAAGPAAQLHILGCLVEICEYPRCVDQLMYWRRRPKNFTKRFAQGDEFHLPESRAGGNSVKVGDGAGDILLDRDASLSALLCELWRFEEKRFKVLRETNGVIASLDKPLMSEFSRDYDKRIPNSSECNGPSCLDLICSIRPKIYLLMKKIVEASNTEATAFGGLSLPNQITMQIIINFLDLKRGEIWLEMVDELRREEIKLVDSDEIALTRFLKISRNKVSAVIDTQRYLLNRSQEQDEMNERDLYNTIQTCYLQKHLEALKEAEFFARTSNYFLLVDKRLWQKAQLQQVVRTVGNVNARVHRTTDHSLNITNWPGRTKIVVSEPTFLMENFDETSAQAEANKYLNVPENDEDDYTRLLGDEDECEESNEGEGPDRKNPLVPSSFEPNTVFGSTEEGFAQIAPQALKKALLSLLAEEKKWKWRDAVGENAWRMRSKWRSNWYSGQSGTGA